MRCNLQEEQALIPIEQQTIMFYGKPVIVVRLPDGRPGVVLRYLCDNLQLDPGGVSNLWGEMGEKFMRHPPLKYANEDVVDCDSHRLDASGLWCGYSCLRLRHWKGAWAKTGKRREFRVSNS
jgi:hypothetical protein